MSSSQTAPDLTVSKMEPIRLLLVDDDTGFLEVSKLILLEMDNTLQIEYASSVEEGVRKLSAESFDIVVSDFEMPVKTGLDFLKILRELRIFTPFILFTGKGREEIAIQALNLGAEGYFNKQGSPETVYGELLHGIKKAACHKRAQEALRISQAKFAQAFKNNPTAVTITRLSDGKIIDANDEITEILGYLPVEVIRKSTVDLNIWADSEDRKKFVNDLNEKGAVHREVLLKRKSGQVIWVNASASRIDIEGEACMISSFVDINEQKEMQENQKRGNAAVEKIIDQITDGICTINRGWNFVYVNQKMAKIIGNRLLS